MLPAHTRTASLKSDSAASRLVAYSQTRSALFWPTIASTAVADQMILEHEKIFVGLEFAIFKLKFLNNDKEMRLSAWQN